MLDLACEEGVFGVEFARHGAEVVAVDGREAHPPPRWDDFRRPDRHAIATTTGWIRDRLRRSRLGGPLRRLKRGLRR